MLTLPDSCESARAFVSSPKVCGVFLEKGKSCSKTDLAGTLEKRSCAQEVEMSVLYYVGKDHKDQ